jgi:16S rRNA (uracil1498-N3)-methyltransferase
MPANRYFTHQDLEKDPLIQLEGDEALHLRTVMRNVEGDAVELINGKGLLAHAKVTEISKKAVCLKIEHVERFIKPFEIEIGIGMLVQERLDLILEKGCELGVTKIFLIRTQSVGKSGFTDGQMERMQRVLIAALKQSGRVWLPSIDLVPSLDAFVSTAKNIYFGDINSNSPALLEVFDTTSPFRLLVGPAKGFTKEELDLLKNKKNIQGVYLSDAILRAETAAVLMIGLVNHAFLLKQPHSKDRG